MARKIKKASHYLLILVLAIMMIGFNLIGGSYWMTLVNKADADSEIAYTSVSVGNVAPTVSNVQLGAVPRGADSITLTENTDIDILASATVTDSTCADIMGAEAWLFPSSASWEYNVDTSGRVSCSLSYNECYQPQEHGGNIQCVQQSCTEGAPATALYDCTASGGSLGDGMWYHADPTDSTSSWTEVLGWYLMVIATDSKGFDAFATNSTQTIELQRLNALSLDEGSDSIAYGTVAPGALSAVIGRGIRNSGNHEIDIQVSVSSTLFESTNGYIIATQQQEYASDSFDISNGNGTSLSDQVTDFNQLILTKPASHSAGLQSDDQIYWGLAVPAATTAGLYSGGNTYIATGEQ